MRTLQNYITHHHRFALSDPRYLPVYLALATLVTIFASTTGWLVLIFTIFSQFNLYRLGFINEFLTLAGIGIFFDFHRNQNLTRLLYGTMLIAIAVIVSTAWFLGPIVPTVAWLFDIPALAIFLLGTRRGLMAIVIFFVCVGLALKFGDAQPIVADSVTTMVAYFINVMGATLILVLQLSFYDASRRAMQEALRNKNRELEVLSTTDRLTGLFNRSKLDQAFAFELVGSARNAQSLSIILVDLDHFKRVNDEFGHSVGDDVLVSMAALLRQVSRDTDILGRWGGEEFLLICTDTSLAGALMLAERLRSLIAGFNFPQVGSKTASFGVSCYRDGDDARSMLIRADVALYRAKECGRNQVQAEST